MLADDVPGQTGLDSLLFVAEHIADARDLPPRDVGMGFLRRGGKVPAGLGDDLQASFDGPPNHPIVRVILKREAGNGGADALDGIQHVH